jgi:hypothetical protein
MFKLEINRRWGLTEVGHKLVSLMDHIRILVLGFVMESGLEHSHANGSFTTAAMYAKATVMDTAPMTGAEGCVG